MALLFWALAAYNPILGSFDLPAINLSSFDYNFEVLDRWPYGSGFSVLLDSNAVFHTNGAVLQIGKIDAEGSITWLSDFTFPGLAYTMAKSQDRLYVAVDDEGVAVLDVSFLEDPRQVNLFSTGGRVFGIDVRGDTIYAGMGSEGLRIYGCTDAQNPYLIGSYSGYNIRKPRLYGEYLYASVPDYGLVNLDVSDPALPVLAAGIELSGQHYGLALDTVLEIAVLCSFDHGANLLDISEPTALTLSEHLDMDGAWAADIHDSVAWVASWNDSIYSVNLESEEKTASLGFDTINVWPYDISSNDKYCAVSGFLGKSVILDKTTLEITDFQEKGGASEMVAGNEGFIALGTQGSRLAFFERGDTLVPSFNLATSDWPRDAEFRGDTFYVAESWSGLGIYRVGAGQVDTLSHLTLEGIHLWSVLVDYPHAYLACGDSGLVVADVSDPYSPVEVSRYVLESRALSLAKKKDTLLVGVEEPGIMALDVSIPQVPTAIRFESATGTVLDMSLTNQFLFTAEGFAGARIYDTSTPDWDLISAIPTDHVVLSLDLDENRIFLSEGAAGLSAYDIGDPGSPQLVGKLDTGGEARDIFFSADTLWIADGYDGLVKVKYLGAGVGEKQTERNSVIRVYPNPFSTTLHFNTMVQAKVYDANGKHCGDVNGSTWDASRLSPGVYFIKGKGWKIKTIKVGLIP